MLGNSFQKKLLDKIARGSADKYTSLDLRFRDSTLEANFVNHAIDSNYKTIQSSAGVVTLTLGFLNVIFFVTDKGYHEMSAEYVVAVVSRIVCWLCAALTWLLFRCGTVLTATKWRWLWTSALFPVFMVNEYHLFASRGSLVEDAPIYCVYMWIACLSFTTNFRTTRFLMVLSALCNLALSIVWDHVRGVLSLRSFGMVLSVVVINTSTAVTLAWSIDFNRRQAYIALLEARKIMEKLSPANVALFASCANAPVLRPLAAAAFARPHSGLAGVAAVGELRVSQQMSVSLILSGGDASGQLSAPAIALTPASSEELSEGSISRENRRPFSSLHSPLELSSDQLDQAEGGAQPTSYNSNESDVGDLDEEARSMAFSNLMDLASTANLTCLSTFSNSGLEAEYRRMLCMQYRNVIQAFMVLFFFAHVLQSFMDMWELGIDARWVLAVRLAYGVPVFLGGYYSSQTLFFHNRMQSVLFTHQLLFVPFLLMALVTASYSTAFPDYQSNFYIVFLFRVIIQDVIAFPIVEPLVMLFGLVVVVAVIATAFFMKGGMAAQYRWVLVFVALVAIIVRISFSLNHTRRKLFLIRRHLRRLRISNSAVGSVEDAFGRDFLEDTAPQQGEFVENAFERPIPPLSSRPGEDVAGAKVLVVPTVKGSVLGLGVHFLRASNLTFTKEYLEAEYNSLHYHHWRICTMITLLLGAVAVVIKAVWVAVDVSTSNVGLSIGVRVACLVAIASVLPLLARKNPGAKVASRYQLLLALAYSAFISLFSSLNALEHDAETLLETGVPPSLVAVLFSASLLLGLRARLLVPANFFFGFLPNVVVYMQAASMVQNIFRGVQICVFLGCLLAVTTVAAIVVEISHRKRYLMLVRAHSRNGLEMPLLELAALCEQEAADVGNPQGYAPFVVKHFFPFARSLVPYVLCPTLIFAVQDVCIRETGTVHQVTVLAARILTAIFPAGVALCLLQMESLGNRLPSIWACLSFCTLLGSMIPIVIDVGLGPRLHETLIVNETVALALTAAVAFSAGLLTRTHIVALAVFLTGILLSYIACMDSGASQYLGVLVVVFAGAHAGFRNSRQLKAAYLADRLVHATVTIKTSEDVELWLKNSTESTSLESTRGSASELFLPQTTDILFASSLEATATSQEEMEQLQEFFSEEAYHARMNYAPSG